jgi:non-ribosomal peptide synthetase component F
VLRPHTCTLFAQVIYFHTCWYGREQHVMGLPTHTLIFDTSVPIGVKFSLPYPARRDVTPVFGLDVMQHAPLGRSARLRVATPAIYQGSLALIRASLPLM